MVRPYLPLNGLRAFEASARHLSFTRAAIELNVTQAAVSHQVNALERQLGITLFRRLPRGLMITPEAEALLPVLRDSFDRMADAVGRVSAGKVRDVLSVGAVGTFALGWLLPRLHHFRDTHPFVELRLSTNNNRVDLAAEGLDFAIRFGNGAWHATEAIHLLDAPMTPLCHPSILGELRSPADLGGQILLRSYRADEWTKWFEAVGHRNTALKTDSIVFDSTLGMAEAIRQGAGVGLAPATLFEQDISAGRMARPFEASVSLGSYWLTRLHSRPLNPTMKGFSNWILAQ